VSLGDNYNYHVHMMSSQLCNAAVEEHYIQTVVVRDNTAVSPPSTAIGGPNFGIQTDAYAAAHSAGDHLWYNDSDFWCESNGLFIQGPVGLFGGWDHRLY